MASANAPSYFSGGLASPVGTSMLTVISNALPLMVLSFGFMDQYSDFLQSQRLENYQKNVVEEYDFIIGKCKVPHIIQIPMTTFKIERNWIENLVGAGSAGSVLANRLTSNPNYKVRHLIVAYSTYIIN